MDDDPIDLPRGIAARLTSPAPGVPAVVVIHGYGSRKENHADFVQRLVAGGYAGLALDLPGHGDSAGALDAGALDAVVSAIDELHARGHRRIGLRGSSLGGFLALNAAARRPDVVGAVAAICPAHGDRLAARLEDPWPQALDTDAAVRIPGVARGYWHAFGDEVVPWPGTFRLAQISPPPVRMHISNGGHHRSLQHDPTIQAATLAFLSEHLG